MEDVQVIYLEEPFEFLEAGDGSSKMEDSVSPAIAWEICVRIKVIVGGDGR